MAIKNAAVLSINDGEGVPFEDTSSSSGDVFTKDSPCVEGSVLSTRFLKFKCDFSGVLTVPPPPVLYLQFHFFPSALIVSHNSYKTLHHQHFAPHIYYKT